MDPGLKLGEGHHAGASMHGQWLRTSVLLALMLYSIPKLRSTHRNLDLTEMDFLPYGKMLLIKEMELPYKETVIHLINLSWASLVAQKVSVCLQCRRPGFDPQVGKIPWRRKWQPTLVFLPGESHRQRSLVGYSRWACKESDTTEWLHFHFETWVSKMSILQAPQWNAKEKQMKKAVKNLILKLILSRPFYKRNPRTDCQEPWDDPFDKDRVFLLGTELDPSPTFWWTRKGPDSFPMSSFITNAFGMNWSCHWERLMAWKLPGASGKKRPFNHSFWPS